MDTSDKDDPTPVSSYGHFPAHKAPSQAQTTQVVATMTDQHTDAVTVRDSMDHTTAPKTTSPTTAATTTTTTTTTTTVIEFIVCPCTRMLTNKWNL